MSFCHCSINWRTMTNIRPPLSHFLPGLKLSSCHICHGARYCRNHSIHLTHGVITPLMGHSLNFPENTKTQHTWVAESKFGVFTIICVSQGDQWYFFQRRILHWGFFHTSWYFFPSLGLIWTYIYFFGYKTMKIDNFSLFWHQITVFYREKIPKK